VKPPPSNSVVHLELHTGDLAGARCFYEGLCGWRCDRIEAGGGSYLALELGPRLGGGIVECGIGRASWLPYIRVANLEQATDRARVLGASVLLEPREGPAGWRSVVSAPAGAEIALWQPKPHHR